MKNTEETDDEGTLEIAYNLNKSMTRKKSGRIRAQIRTLNLAN